MARRRGPKQYTIYDRMEENGVFDANPANSYARDEDGQSIYERQEYPKMLYHPMGDTVVTKAAEEIVTPFGPKRVGEQREMINRIVRTKEEEDRWLAAGWHTSPNFAQATGLGVEPVLTPMEELAFLKKKLAQMEQEKADQQEGDPEDRVDSAAPLHIRPATRPFSTAAEG